MERTWETCIAFHGHPCPVLATGYRASVEALRILHITDLHREKLACIAENQVCGVDAVQIMLNCTLAKGNIIIRNHGKQVYTVVRLSDGKAVRLSLRNELALPWPDPDVWPENAGWAELTDTILHAPAEQVFKITEESISLELPFVGHVFQYKTCSGCGELVSEYAAHIQNGKCYCMDCYHAERPKLNGLYLLIPIISPQTACSRNRLHAVSIPRCGYSSILSAFLHKTILSFLDNISDYLI